MVFTGPLLDRAYVVDGVEESLDGTASAFFKEALEGGEGLEEHALPGRAPVEGSEGLAMYFLAQQLDVKKAER